MRFINSPVSRLAGSKAESIYFNEGKTICRLPEAAAKNPLAKQDEAGHRQRLLYAVFP